MTRVVIIDDKGQTVDPEELTDTGLGDMILGCDRLKDRCQELYERCSRSSNPHAPQPSSLTKLHKENKMRETNDFYVDVPPAEFTPGDEIAWVNVDSFQTREEAVAFAQEHYGADEVGRVGLVTGIPEEDYPENRAQTVVQRQTQALKDIINAADNGQPYSPEDLARVFVRDYNAGYELLADLGLLESDGNPTKASR